MTMTTPTPFTLVRRQSVLQNAWRKVRENGIRSQSEDTREKVKRFDSEAFRHLRRIEDQLRGRRFRFEPQKGIAKRRPGKSPRPLVVAEVKNRIVQRAILDVLQGISGIREILFTPTSYGGIKERGVQQAIAAACMAIDAGAKYHIRSDIEGFFTKIPRPQVLEEIERHVADPDFMVLLKNGTDTELANLEQLGDDAQLFPLDETGVAQGSALSPLLGNILLKDFDREMNGRGITCIRYIDDFLLLGPAPGMVRKAFQSAQKKLSAHGLRAYDPTVEKKKAEEGFVAEGIVFLGCQIDRGKLINPSATARKRLLDAVKKSIQAGRTGIRIAEKGEPRKLPRQRYAQTLVDIDNVVQGWGHAFAFCTGRLVFEELDRKIDILLSEFFGFTRRRASGKASKTSRRILGVHLLTDIPEIPLPS